MEGLIIILGGAGFVALIYKIWINTKAGKKNGLPIYSIKKVSRELS